MKYEILPFGSIVTLKGDNHKYMIIGFSQIANDGKGTYYDYVACIHPFGYLSSSDLFLFNANQVNNVIFKGFYDIDSKEYLEDVLWARSKKNDAKES